MTSARYFGESFRKKIEKREKVHAGTFVHPKVRVVGGNSGFHRKPIRVNVSVNCGFLCA